MKKGYLVLQDGRVFEGIRFGAQLDAVGELVFNTSAGSFIEIMTDPACAGQIVMQTYLSSATMVSFVRMWKAPAV